MKWVIGLIGGLLVAWLGGLAVDLNDRGDQPSADRWAITTFALLWVGTIVVALRSASAGQALTRLLTALCAMSFALPLSALWWSDQHADGKSFLAVLAGYGGFLLGVFLLVIVLVLRWLRRPKRANVRRGSSEVNRR